MPRNYKLKQLEGETFGIYKVTGKTGKVNPRKHPYWEAVCMNCSAKKEFLTEQLTRNMGTSYCACTPKPKRIRIKPHTIRVKALKHIKDEKVHLDYFRPTHRGECCNDIRPCPFVGCRHNLYLDVNEDTGSISIHNAGIEPDEVTGESCALDVADRGNITSEHIGEILNISQQRVEQIKVKAFDKIKKAIINESMTDLYPGREVFRDTIDNFTITEEDEDEFKAWNTQAVV